MNNIVKKYVSESRRKTCKIIICGTHCVLECIMIVWFSALWRKILQCTCNKIKFSFIYFAFYSKALFLLQAHVICIVYAVNNEDSMEGVSSRVASCHRKQSTDEVAIIYKMAYIVQWL